MGPVPEQSTNHQSIKERAGIKMTEIDQKCRTLDIAFWNPRSGAIAIQPRLAKGFGDFRKDKPCCLMEIVHFLC